MGCRKTRRKSLSDPTKTIDPLMILSLDLLTVVFVSGPKAHKIQFHPTHSSVGSRTAIFVSHSGKPD